MSGFEEMPEGVPQVPPAGSLPRLFGDVDVRAARGPSGESGRLDGPKVRKCGGGVDAAVGVGDASEVGFGQSGILPEPPIRLKRGTGMKRSASTDATATYAAFEGGPC